MYSKRLFFHVQGYIRYAKSGCVENLVNAETLTHVKFAAVSGKVLIMLLVIQCEHL